MEDVLENILRSKKKPKRTKKKFQKMKCHPRNYTSKNTHYKDSCLDTNTLQMMKQIWNRRYPDNMIRTKNPKLLWSTLKKNMSNSCSNEMCWLNNTINDNVVKNKLKKKLFAPYSPYSWKKNKNEWLSSVDINDVMRQYEETYPQFKFFGPSPIDFDTMEYKNQCVWPEICHLDIADMKKQNKTKLGFIFNTDDHTKGGSHWIAMFVDLEKKFCFYFDSNGIEAPKEIDALMKKIYNQCKEKCEMNIKLDSNHPLVHQCTDTECGMYCLYFIVSLLKNKHNFHYFKKKRIPDKHVENFRQIYFNPAN